jgi:hypothetical protein
MGRLFRRRKEIDDAVGEDHLPMGLTPARLELHATVTISNAQGPTTIDVVAFTGPTGAEQCGSFCRDRGVPLLPAPSVTRPRRAMPTQAQVQEWRALRGRFLNALWDADHEDNDVALVGDLIAKIGASNLPTNQVDRLVYDLRNDGLIHDIGMGAIEEQSVRLTSEGRSEVEQWLSEPDAPTAHLPVPANQVFNITNMNVTGPVLQGSSANNVTTTSGVSGDVLVKLVSQFRELLSTADLPADDREAIEADLEVIEEEAATDQPRPGRLRPFLRRLRDVLEKGALAGIQVGTKQEVIHLIEQAQQALPG